MWTSYKQTHPDGTPMLAYRTHFKERPLHPKITKKGIVKSELTRIRNTTSDDDKASETLDFISNQFIQRSYPQSVVDQERQSLTSTSARHPLSSILKLPYVRRSQHINSIFKHTWETTITEQSQLNLFPTPPMVVYTRQRNLATFYVVQCHPALYQRELLHLPSQPHPYLSKYTLMDILNANDPPNSHNLHGHPLTQYLNC